eukprot:TRINITY_DN1685_c0_g1_i1.p2 TRINITY_DN1685_c0_g1~~TRINITY_DN1685_c0_g1_i1.p2  ORF type:complete len:255 (-),score=56.12 TRINITY_DN1685_c0_g1_i1:53-817(-)
MMSYETDRDPAVQPSLAQMSAKALDLLLEAGNENGFFLLIEGSRIDLAAHVNDAASMYRDALAFDETIAVVMDFAAQHPQTQVIITADHETGGTTLGRDGIYDWHPEVLHGVQRSTEFMTQQLLAGQPIMDMFRQFTNITSLSTAEHSRIQQHVAARNPQETMFAIADVINVRALVGFTTHAHSGVDVNIYANNGPVTSMVTHNHENTDIGAAMAHYLHVNFAETTARIQRAYGSEPVQAKPQQKNAFDDLFAH